MTSRLSVLCRIGLGRFRAVFFDQRSYKVIIVGFGMMIRVC